MASLAPSWHWKDWTIAALTAALVIVGGLWLAQALETRSGEAALGGEGAEEGAEVVRVFDVVLDRENRKFVDVLFDRPVAEGRAGEILGLPPATVEPPLAGVWRWRDEQILRFEPSGGFPVASRYELALIPGRFLEDGQVLQGESTFDLETDRFLLEQVSVQEVPSPLGGGRVTLRGRLQFNYAVDPRQLAPLVHLVDPAAGKEPIEVELEDVYWNRPTIEFRTGEIQKQKAARTLKLVVDGTLTPSVGNAPLGEDAVQEIPLGSRDRLAVREVTSTPGLDESTVTIELSSRVDPRLAGKYLKITPEAKYRASAQGNTLSLTGSFRPGGSYALALAAGLPADDGATLPDPYETTVTLANLSPSLDFESQGSFLAASGERNVAVQSVNVSRFELAIDRAYANNLFFLFDYADLLGSDSTYSGSSIEHTFGDRIVEQTVRVKAARNTQGTTVVPVGQYLSDYFAEHGSPSGAPDQPGLYRVTIARPGQWQATQRWLLLTDLGAVVKRAPGEVLAWVSSVRTLAPVAGARVTLISDQNQAIAQGRTDADGFWRFRDAAQLDEHRPYLVKVEKGDDFTFVALDRMGIDTTGLEVGGAPSTTDGYSAFLYGERDLYRPGETAEGMAIVRDGALRPAPAMPALLRHRDPRGLEVETRTVKIDDRGLAPFELDLPAYALTGNHTVELEVGERVVGRYRFQVEEFIPDRIKVEITPAEENLATGPSPGQDLVFDVASSYLFGPPAASLPVEARVRLVPADFQPKGFDGFSFKNAERQLDPREILTSEDTLDETGHRSFTASIPAGLEPASSLQAVITARVSEQGGRGVAARTSVPVHPYPYYLGLRRVGNGSPQPGEEVELEVAAVTPDGKATPAEELRAELYFVRWHTLLRKTASGSYKYETVREPVLVADQTLPAGEARASFRFTPADYGSHQVVITDPASGASAAVTFWVSGWGYAPWAMENPSRIELELGKDEYAPGDSATVQVRAPFPGRLLLTVERDQVFYTHVYDLAENTATVQVPIRRDFRPNAYVTATLVRKVSDLEPGGVGRAFGAIPLPVDRTANRQAVRIDAPEQVRSASHLEVTAHAAPGSVVTVAAVDEGILQLIAQRTPDPFEFFYRKLALGVSSFDTFSLLLPEVAVEGAAQAGGGYAGEGAAQYVRTEGIRRVEPVAFWSGPVVAGTDGRAVARFDLPEFQGALRLMAVAVKDATMGSSDRQTRVRDPLVLLPTLPRILSFDETLQVPVTVRNDTGRSGPVQVTVEVDGPARTEGDATLSIPLDDGSEGTVYFSIHTDQAARGRRSEIRFAFQAEGLGESSKASGRVGVRADLPPEASEQAGSLTDATLEIPLATPMELRPESVRREIRVSSLPLVQLTGKLDALVRYPYGCLEQTVSKAFPQIYLADLIQAVDPKLLDPDRVDRPDPVDPKANVAEALRRVAGLQLADGGFALWPGWDDAQPWTSVYAAHFLVEAERAGYPVASHVRQRALDFLGSQVRAKSSYGATELERTAYALYVLARAGQADLGTMDFLRGKHLSELEPQSKALLAAAYAAVGRRDTVDELVARIDELERVERQTGGNFDSTVRNRALLLMALLDADPESSRVPALADRLAREAVADPWWTTQEAGFTLLALGQLYHRQAERPPFRGKVYLGERLLGPVSTDQPAHFAGLSGAGPVRVVMDSGYQKGAAFYSVITRGLPTDEDFRPTAAGLEIERTYLTREGGTAALDQVRQGDLLVIRTRVRSIAGPVENVVIENLLPSGVEVENPRLETTETLPWAQPSSLGASHLDLRDDRILLFTDLPADDWQTVYALVRAVSPGSFRLPPAHAEAMYDPALRATGQRGRMEVKLRDEP